MSTSTRQGILAILLVLFTSALTAGCYTVLRHPAVEVVAEDAGQDCASCHSEADIHHFRDPFMDPYGYYDYGVTRWYGYYGLPWWYDGYWYFPRHDDDMQVRSGDRHLWERGSAPAPSPLPRVGSAPPTPRVEGTPSGGSRSERKGDGKDDSKDKKKKRRLWGRGG